MAYQPYLLSASGTNFCASCFVAKTPHSVHCFLLCHCHIRVPRSDVIHIYYLGLLFLQYTVNFVNVHTSWACWSYSINWSISGTWLLRSVILTDAVMRLYFFFWVKWLVCLLSFTFSIEAVALFLFMLYTKEYPRLSVWWRQKRVRENYPSLCHHSIRL